MSLSGTFRPSRQANAYGQASCHMCASMGNCSHMFRCRANLRRCLRLSFHHRIGRGGLQSPYPGIPLPILHQAIAWCESWYLACNGAHGVSRSSTLERCYAELAGVSSMVSLPTRCRSFIATLLSLGGYCSSSKVASHCYLQLSR